MQEQKLKPEDLKHFEQVAKVIGNDAAKAEIQKVIDEGIFIDKNEILTLVFNWDRTPQGRSFWKGIFNGMPPEGYKATSGQKETEWPDENNPRQQAIEQNGNDGEVYKEPERMTGGYRDVGKSESVGMKDKYPKYYKDVSGLNEIDVYQIHNLFDVQDASGCLQHASKKLLLSGVRTGGKSKYDDIREARDTLTRWLAINSGK